MAALQPVGQVSESGCITSGKSSFARFVDHFADNTRQFQEVLEHSSILLTAAKNSPVAVSGACAAIATGFLISRVQPGWIMLASMTSFAVGTILLATNPVGRSYWAQSFVGAVIVCWGMVSLAFNIKQDHS